MRGRFAIYLIFIITFFIAIMIFLLGIFGILNPTAEQIKNELDGMLIKHTETVERDIDELAACAILMSDHLEKDVSDFLSEKNISFEELENNALLLEQLQSKLYNSVYLNMQVAHPSGAFCILNTTVNNSAESRYRNGIYLKYVNLFSENTVNNDFSLFRGSFTTGRRNGIKFHSGWKNECRTDFFEKYNEQFTNGVHYMLSPVVDIPDTWERARFVYVPFRDIKENVIGVCGFEFNDLLFQLSHKADNSDLGYIVCALLDEKDNVYSGQFNSGRYRISDGAENEKFRISEKGDFTIFDFGSEVCIGRTNVVSLGNGVFTVAVMMQKTSYDKLIRKGQLKIAWIFFIIAVLAVCCCVFMSKKYISPIIRKIELIKSNENSPDSPKIAEIDDLFVFLGEKDLYVEAKLEELEKARMAAEAEADVAKEKYDAALKKYELAQTEIKRLSENSQAEINAEEYEYFISNLNTLTSTESKIYELYLEGKKADEISAIMGITLNTLKFHNKNIYSKLGISSRKQLLKYASIKKYQDKNT